MCFSGLLNYHTLQMIHRWQWKRKIIRPTKKHNVNPIVKYQGSGSCLIPNGFSLVDVVMGKTKIKQKPNNFASVDCEYLEKHNEEFKEYH